MDRKQLVDWKNEKSQLRVVGTGVAQGSVLAAYLFVLYMNDLPDCVSSASVFLYADDTSLITYDRSRAELVNKADNAVKETGEWFADNGLKLNTNKTQQLLLTTRRGGEAEIIKFLGVHISSDLKWSSHISKINANLSRAIYAIRRMRKIANYHAALTTYHSFFMSRATYAILVWGASKEAEAILIRQKEAVRALMGLNYRQSCREVFKVNKLMTIPSVYILQALQNVHKADDGEYIQRKNCHEYPTRQSNNLQIPKHRLQITQNTYKYNSIKLYNKLPKQIVNLPKNKFRSSIKNILLENAFYSIAEFMEFDFKVYL